MHVPKGGPAGDDEAVALSEKPQVDEGIEHPLRRSRDRLVPVDYLSRRVPGLKVSHRRVARARIVTRHKHNTIPPRPTQLVQTSSSTR